MTDQPNLEAIQRAISELCQEAHRSLARQIASGEITIDDVVIHPEQERVYRRLAYEHALRDWYDKPL